MNPVLYLLDGYGLIYKSYFAFINRPLTNPAGQNSSAVFGFFRSLHMLLRLEQPEYLVVAMDSRTPTFRHQAYAEYKATREKSPDDLKAQIPVVEEILAALRIPVLRVNGYEADDVIATLVRRCREKGRPARVISADKDLLQLVTDDIHVLKQDKGEFHDLGPEAVREAWGVGPEQIGDYLALVGDSSDNVPGVAGVGAKTAAKLLQEYETLQVIYERLEHIKSDSWRRKLEEGRDRAFLSRTLVELASDVPIESSIEDFSIAEMDGAAAAPLFLREGMERVARDFAGDDAEVPEDGAAAAPARPRDQRLDQGLDPSGALSDPASARHDSGLVVPPELSRDARGSYKLLQSAQDLNAWINRAIEAGVCALDLETTDINSLHAEPVGISLALDIGDACYAVLVGPDGAGISADAARDALGRLFAADVLVVGQNFKYDYKVLSRFGSGAPSRIADTMVAAWLLDTTANRYNMDILAEQYLGYRTIHYADLFPGRKPGVFSSVPLDRALDYAAEDADITLRLWKVFEPELHRRGFDSLFLETEMPLIPILAQMELRGIRLDADQLNAYDGELAGELTRLEQKIYQLVGHEFNIASTKQLQTVLFDERELKPVKKTKTGYSTDTSVLEQLAREDPVPELVLRHRTLSKLRSTYVEALPRLINPDTGRLHTHFNLTGTATGRLSSTDPNLQNIPIRDEEGRRIREAFVPQPGWRFVSADYSQIELVVLAHLSGDPGLLSAFREGKDVHRETGALIFGVAPEGVSADQRRIAKTINFGVMYGMSSFRLSNELGIPRGDAQGFIDRYFQTYSGIRSFIQRTVEEAEERGVVRTILGRERRIPGINSGNRNEKQGAERIAVNTPIQGSAADIVKRAMISVARELEHSGMQARMLLQVHDELILECPEDEADGVRDLLQRVMPEAIELSLPLRVSVEDGQSWGAMH